MLSSTTSTKFGVLVITTFTGDFGEVILGDFGDKTGVSSSEINLEGALRFLFSGVNNKDESDRMSVAVVLSFPVVVSFFSYNILPHIVKAFWNNITFFISFSPMYNVCFVVFSMCVHYKS